MADMIFYPYEYEPNELELSLTDAAAEGIDARLMDYADHDAQNLEIVEIEGWSELNLEFRVDYQPSASPEERERKGDSPHVYIVLQSTDSRARQAFKLDSKSPTSWCGRVHVPRNRWAGVVRISPVATALDGTKLASGAKWDLYLDKKDILPGGLMAMEWQSFSESSNPEVRKRHDCGWYWDLAHETKPRLLVNEEIQHMKDAFNVVAHHGKPAMLRNMAIQVMFLPALVELVLDSLEKLRGETLQESEGFRKSVLLSVARHSGRGDGEHKAQLWLDASTEDRDRVHAEVMTGCQRQLKTWIRVSKSLDVLGGYDNG